MADDFTIDPSGFRLGEGPTYTSGGDYNFYNDSAPSNMDWGQFFGGLGTSFGGSPLDTSLPTLPYGYTPNAPASTSNLGLLQRTMQALLGGSSQPASGTPPGSGAQGGQQQPGIISQLASSLIPAAGVASGIGGIIQNLTQGRPTTQQQLRSTVQESPQQSQLTGQTLQALQNLQGIAQNSQLQMAINNLLAGKLPITPDLVDQVTKAFGGSMSGLMKSTAENARLRGFHGSEGDVALGAGAPVFAQGINDLENQVNSALVNLALGIPGTAANMQSQLVNQAAAPISLSENLIGQLGQFAGLQGGRDVTTLAPKPTLLSALGPLSQLAGGLGQMGASRSMFQPQQGSNLSGVDS